MNPNYSKNGTITQLFLMILVLMLLSGCSGTKTKQLYTGQDAATVEVTAGGGAGWLSNTLASFWCKITDIDGTYRGHNEKVQVAPGVHTFKVRWSRVTTPPGTTPMKSVRGSKILKLDVQESVNYTVACSVRRTPRGYIGSMSLENSSTHVYTWCKSDDAACLDAPL